MGKLDRAKATAKIKKLMPTVGLRSPEHFHIDDLFEDPLPAESIISVCSELLEVAIETLGAQTKKTQALIIMPLRPAETFQPKPPGKKQLLEELVDEEVEPPGLYLMDRAAWGLIVKQEEYRRPIPIPEFVKDDWYPEYKTTRRDPQDLFIRSIWIQHLPDEFVG